MPTDLTLSLAPTVSTSAYSATYCAGGKLTLPLPSAPVLVQNITVIDKDAQNAPLTVLFFEDDPSGTTFTDRAALTVAAADLSKIVGVVSIAATDYVTTGGASVATVKPGAFVVAGPPVGASRNLYAAIVVGGSATWTATTGKLNVRVGLVRA